MVRDRSEHGQGQVIANLVVTALVFPALVLSLAGDWRWTEGWIFALWMVAMIDTNTAYLYLHDPELLAERSKLSGANNQKRWDTYVLTALGLIAIAWLVIMPLDAKRYGWTVFRFPTWLKALGGGALLPSLFLILRSTVENTFLSTMVRMQPERKQRVISTGVYGLVRHPLYLGCMLMMFGAPLLLGSVYGLALALVGTVLVVGRIVGEERMLVSELDGYAEYRTKVRYRLVPFVW